MRSIFLAETRNRLGIFEYGKVLFLFLLMSACLASSLTAGPAGQPPPADNMDIPYSQGIGNVVMTREDACPTREEIISKTRTLQMPFMVNNGQVDGQVSFYAKTFGGTVFVTKEGEIVYALPGSEKTEVRRQNLCLVGHGEIQRTAPVKIGLSGHDSFSLFNRLYSYLNSLSSIPRSIAIKETMIGAKIGGITGEQPAATTVNYFKGNDESKWKTNVPTYNRVSLGEVYKGIELSLKAYSNNVEKLFCVKPGANPAFIKVQLDGGKSLRVNHDGQLEADTELGQVRFTRPIAYQEIEGNRVEVSVEYSIHGSGIDGTEGRGEPETQNSKLIYGFTVASYDKTHDLIIDPLLASTFLGGAINEFGTSLAVDKKGGKSIYVTGCTGSSNFPTKLGAYDTIFNGSSDYDVFVSRLDIGLTTLLASTFLGGSSYDYSYSIAIDKKGSVYVTGHTQSANFPTSPMSVPYDGTFNGGFDVFVSKLSSGLTTLLASTFLGGSTDEYGYSLAIDKKGNVCVTGYTFSTNFPTTPGAYDNTFNGGTYDVFVSNLNSGLTNLQASTFLGGSGNDYGSSLAIDDKEGNVYVTGYTQSANFPTSPMSPPYDSTFNGGSDDVFVSRLNGGLTSLLASTFLGGSDNEWGNSLVVDNKGSVYVTGWTGSSNFPTTPGAYNPTFNGGTSDVFVSRLNMGLTSLLASTFLGQAGDEWGNSLAVNKKGSVYVTGWTGSSDFPTTPGAYNILYNGAVDVFVSKLNSGLTSLQVSTFLGASGGEWGNFLALDTSGKVYVTGYTWSLNFPTTPGAYDELYNSNWDVFVSKLDSGLSL